MTTRRSTYWAPNSAPRSPYCIFRQPTRDTYLGEVGSAANASGGTTATLSVGLAVPVGAMVIVAVVSPQASVSSLTDSAGNTWSSDEGYYAGQGAELGLWRSVLTTALTTSDTITVDFSASASVYDVVALAFGGLTGSLLSKGANYTGTPNSAFDVALAASETAPLVLVAVASEASYTSGPAFTTFAGPVAESQFGYAVVTSGSGTFSTTYTSSGSVTGISYGVAALAAYN